MSHRKSYLPYYHWFSIPRRYEIFDKFARATIPIFRRWTLLCWKNKLSLYCSIVEQTYLLEHEKCLSLFSIVNSGKIYRKENRPKPLLYTCVYSVGLLLVFTFGVYQSLLSKNKVTIPTLLFWCLSSSGYREETKSNVNMKKHLVYVLISCLALSCTSPEKEAEAIMNQFTSSLHEIGDVTNITAQDLSKKLKTCKEHVDNLVITKRKEFTKPEEKERFDNSISINDNEIYMSLRQELANKNLESLESVKNKKWINVESLSSLSIFMLDETCISFLNLKNKLNYVLEDGEIIFNNDCNNNPIYFTIDGNELVITNGQGQVSRFREATFAEILQAKWKNPYTYGGRYGGSGIILEKDGKGVQFDDNWRPVSYKVNNKTVTTFENSKFGNWVNNYTYLSNDKLQFTTHGVSGTQFYRAKETGPDCIAFLFDGKIKSDTKTKSTFTTSDSKDSDWDSVLDEYEKLIDKYISLYKKAQNGDISAMSDYVGVLESAEKLQTKLEKAESELTTAQMSRLTKIVTKMTNAVL